MAWVERSIPTASRRGRFPAPKTNPAKKRVAWATTAWLTLVPPERRGCRGEPLGGQNRKLGRSPSGPAMVSKPRTHSTRCFYDCSRCGEGGDERTRPSLSRTGARGKRRASHAPKKNPNGVPPDRGCRGEPLGGQNRQARDVLRRHSWRRSLLFLVLQAATATHSQIRQVAGPTLASSKAAVLATLTTSCRTSCSSGQAPAPTTRSHDARRATWMPKHSSKDTAWTTAQREGRTHACITQKAPSDSSVFRARLWPCPTSRGAALARLLSMKCRLLWSRNVAVRQTGDAAVRQAPTTRSHDARRAMWMPKHSLKDTAWTTAQPEGCTHAAMIYV